jgi:hypothetical protein
MNAPSQIQDFPDSLRAKTRDGEKNGARTRQFFNPMA